MATERGKDRSLAAQCKWSIESAPGFRCDSMCVCVCECVLIQLIVVEKRSLCDTPGNANMCTYIHSYGKYTVQAEGSDATTVADEANGVDITHFER